MANKVIFYVTRHGQTILNLLDRVQGWADSPLTQKGIDSAMNLGKSMKDVDFTSIYSSTSGRAQETAETILKELNKKTILIHKDKRLMEWGFGSFEGENNKLFRQAVLDGLGSNISTDNISFYLPEICEVIGSIDTISYAEDFQTIKNRLTSVFNEIAENIYSNGGGNVLIVTHAFIIKTLVYLFANERAKEVNNIKNGSITVITYENEEFHIENINDTSYLE